MKPDLLAAVLAMAAAIPAGAQAKREGAYSPPGYTLQFVDDFNGESLDASRWMYRTDSKALSSQLPRNVRVRNGYLLIDLKKESDRGKAYTGGGVISRQRFGYGYYEARVKKTGIRFYLDGDLRCGLDYPLAAGEHDNLNFWITAIAYEMRARGKGAAQNVDDAGLPGVMTIDFAAFYSKEKQD